LAQDYLRQRHRVAVRIAEVESRLLALQAELVAERSDLDALDMDETRDRDRKGSRRVAIRASRSADVDDVVAGGR
jgi:hypothetical protein